MSKNDKTGALFKQVVPKMPKGYHSGDKPNPSPNLGLNLVLGLARALPNG